MSKVRVVARLDIKNDSVIKGIHLEGLRKVGRPNALASKYYSDGVDEIIFMDAVASYYDRNSLVDVLEVACKEIFVPITVGGGIRTLSDIRNALNAGADKVAINTAAIKQPDFIKEASQTFGSQCVTLSIDAKQIDVGKWEACFDNGREPSGLDVVEWAKKGQALGAGEILLTSIDADGTKKGFDEQLSSQVSDAVLIPVIASGGAGSIMHVLSLLQNTSVNAVAVASILHYGICEIGELKQNLIMNNHMVRYK